MRRWVSLPTGVKWESGRRLPGKWPGKNMVVVPSVVGGAGAGEVAPAPGVSGLGERLGVAGAGRADPVAGGGAVHVVREGVAGVLGHPLADQGGEDGASDPEVRSGEVRGVEPDLAAVLLRLEEDLEGLGLLGGDGLDEVLHLSGSLVVVPGLSPMS